MKTENVNYRKACSSCMSTTGIKHTIIWNGADEFYTNGRLIYQEEARKKILNWHKDTKVKCTNCNSQDNWRIWDIDVSGVNIIKKPYPNTFFKIEGMKRPDGQIAIQSDYGEVSNSIIETAFEYYQKQLDIENSQGKLKNHSRGSFEMTLIEIDKAPWFELQEFEIGGFGYEEMTEMLRNLKSHYITQ